MYNITYNNIFLYLYKLTKIIFLNGALYMQYRHIPDGSIICKNDLNTLPKLNSTDIHQ